jgi:hypothetical protein
MMQKNYSKKTANELCRRLRDGLGFSCRILLMKRTIFSLRGKKYVVETDAPERVLQDIIVTI